MGVAAHQPLSPPHGLSRLGPAYYFKLEGLGTGENFPAQILLWLQQNWPDRFFNSLHTPHAR